MMNIIDIQNLTYYYPGQDRPALNHIDLQVKKGEIVGIIGVSGCGKSTLLRAVSRLIPDFYGGNLAGNVFFGERSLRDWSQKELYRSMGVLSQEAEHSLIFNEVRRDIAFGLENLGISNREMSLKIREVLKYFGLDQLSCRSVHHLSGGERQKTALAGIVAMEPELLVLDEPAGQLDDHTSRDLFLLLKQLNQERGITIVIAEQKLELLLNLADKVAVMEAGEVIFIGTPQEQYSWALRNDYPLTCDCKINHEEKAYAGPDWKEKAGSESTAAVTRPDHVAAVYELNYQYQQIRILKNITLRLYPGQITALTGDNGAGKTTLIKMLLGLLKPGGGEVEVLGRKGKQLRPEIIGQKAAYLPQNLDHYFITDTALAEVELGLRAGGGNHLSARDWLEKLKVDAYAEADPRSLSIGEKQRVAIASLIAAAPQLILLDEPTRGLDIMQKQVLGETLTGLTRTGKAIVLASHDTDFVNTYADRVILMQHGCVIKDELRNGERREAL